MLKKIPCFCVDFNEMVDSTTVLLSAADTRVDAFGARIELHIGMLVNLYMPDLDKNGNVDNLVASGVVVRNTEAGWAENVKWCCRIDSAGIRPESEVVGRSTSWCAKAT